MNMDNISDIIASLSDDDINSLKQTAASIFGDSREEKKEEKSAFDFSGINPEMIGKITRIMCLLNSSSSNPRCDLIKALKPLLSQDKRKRADEALQIMKLMDILPMLQGLNQTII